MALYDRQIQTALRMIKKYGKQVVWNKVITESVPGSSFKQQSRTAVEYKPHVVFFPNSLQNRESLRYMGVTNVPVGSIIGYMGDNGFTPELVDIVIDGPATLRLMNCETLAPNGRPILHILDFE